MPAETLSRVLAEQLHPAAQVIPALVNLNMPPTGLRRNQARCLRWVTSAVLSACSPLPFFPGKQTCQAAAGMSQTCQKRKWASFIHSLRRLARPSSQSPATIAAIVARLIGRQQLLQRRKDAALAQGIGAEVAQQLIVVIQHVQLSRRAPRAALKGIQPRFQAFNCAISANMASRPGRPCRPAMSSANQRACRQ